jgi:hypothetical protein
MRLPSVHVPAPTGYEAFIDGHDEIRAIQYLSVRIEHEVVVWRRIHNSTTRPFLRMRSRSQLSLFSCGRNSWSLSPSVRFEGFFTNPASTLGAGCICGHATSWRTTCPLRRLRRHDFHRSEGATRTQATGRERATRSPRHRPCREGSDGKLSALVTTAFSSSSRQ